MARFFAAGVLLLGPSQALAAPGTATSMLTVLLSLALILGGFVAIAWAIAWVNDRRRRRHASAEPSYDDLDDDVASPLDESGPLPSGP